MCVATAGGWSAATAGRKTVKDSVKVRLVPDIYVNMNDTFQMYYSFNILEAPAEQVQNCKRLGLNMSSH